MSTHMFQTVNGCLGVGYGPTVTEGVWAFEMTLLGTNADVPRAIGVVIPTYACAKDSEYEKGFYGFYHGGASRNVIANGKRIHRSIGESPYCGLARDCPDWEKGMSVGVVVCMDTRALWCTVNGVKIPEKYSLPAGSIPTEVRFAVWSQSCGSDVQIRFPRRL